MRIVVIGGDAAGMSAAAEARRVLPDDEIVVLERGRDVSYAACGLPYWIGGEVAGEDALVAHDAGYFRDRRGIDVRLGAEVTAIDPERRAVRLVGGESLSYDALVVATGARPRRPAIAGVDQPGVFTLRDLESARAIQRHLGGRPAATALVVGGGPIGTEMAEALCARGVAVTLIERADRPLPALDREVAAGAVAALASGCIAVHCGAPLERITPAAGGRLRASTADVTETFDMVVLGTGVQPNSELAAAAGCALGSSGAIAVDRTGRTSVSGIWAAGDCATAWHRLLGRPVWFPLATTANVQGRVAGRAIAGAPARFAGILGSWVSQSFGVGFGATGLDAAAARAAGRDPAAITRTGHDRSGYLPDTGEVAVHLVWDERDGRLLGGQVVGAGRIAPRLQVLATALAGGLTVRELAEADFPYVPPQAPLRDPIELAAAAAIGDAP